MKKDDTQEGTGKKTHVEGKIEENQQQCQLQALTVIPFVVRAWQKGRIPFSATMDKSRLRPRTRNWIVIKQEAKERHQRRMIMMKAKVTLVEARLITEVMRFSILLTKKLLMKHWN